MGFLRACMHGWIAGYKHARQRMVYEREHVYVCTLIACYVVGQLRMYVNY